MSFKVSVDQDKCIGCGACVDACNNFKLIDGKSKPVKTTISEPGCSKKAETICPVHAITVKKA